MTNERYLIVSYFVVAAVSMVIGLGAYGWLRSPVKTLAAALPWRTFGELLRRIFPVGIVFPALLGFVSAKYFGCNVETYQKVIALRDYLVTKKPGTNFSVVCVRDGCGRLLVRDCCPAIGADQAIRAKLKRVSVSAS